MSSDFSAPHLPPVRFVKELIEADKKRAFAGVEFEEVPTIGMLIEAAAQSSSGIKDDDNDGRKGFLVTLKDIKLLKKIDSVSYKIDVKLVYKLNDFKSLSFEVLKESDVIAKGNFSILLQ